MKKTALFCIGLVSIFGLSSCASEAAPTTLLAHIVLLDISGSSVNSQGTFNSLNHSPSSLSERKRQLEEKIKNAVSNRTAVYFGFVRNSYSRTEIATLVPSGLILEIETVLNKDILNEKLKTEAQAGISSSWQKAIEQEILSHDTCSVDTIEKTIFAKSNAAISPDSAQRLARKLCASARNSIYQFNQLQSGAENIGSDIQGAIDRSLQKLASDEKRLVNSEGKSVSLIPTIFLVSDLIQKSKGPSKIDEVFKAASPKEACKLAQDEAKNFSLSFLGKVSLISDGFASTKKEVQATNRDKLMEYWKCWLVTRNITDIDIGANGIDLGGS